MDQWNLHLRKTPLTRLPALTSLVLSLVACGGGIDRVDADLSTAFIPDTLPPTSTLTQTGPLLGMSTSLVIVFSESMDITSLQLAGALGTEAGSAVWSSTIVTNDTLTVSPPVDGWTQGTGRNITVTVADLAGNPASAVAASYQVEPIFATFQSAAVVIGQANFASQSQNAGTSINAKGMRFPTGSPVVTPDGKLFVSDSNNFRVLGYDTIPTMNNASADFALGQPDLTSSTYFGANQGTYGYPQQLALVSGKFAVADPGLNRIVIYNTIPASNTDLPNVVVGQPNVTSDTAACDADSLSYPETVTGTPDGKLIVVDSLNHRVLIWNSVPTMDGQPADLVLGQSDFVHCTRNDTNQDGFNDGVPSARTFNFPTGAWSDGTRLVIGDRDNHRVLIWNTFPTADFQPADLVLGQSDFTRNTRNDDDQDGNIDSSPSARTFHTPQSGIHSDGTRLAVADTYNSRVLIWNTFPTANFQAADIVLGQGDFARFMANDDDQNGASDSDSSPRVLNEPTGVLFYKNKLLVTDQLNNRVLVFRSQ